MVQIESGSFFFPFTSRYYSSFSKVFDFNFFLILMYFFVPFLVPNVYPVDLFEHMWAVDRLERLGISRYFKSEIRECVDYVHRYEKKNAN